MCKYNCHNLISTHICIIRSFNTLIYQYRAEGPFHAISYNTIIVRPSYLECSRHAQYIGISISTPLVFTHVWKLPPTCIFQLYLLEK